MSQFKLKLLVAVGASCAMLGAAAAPPATPPNAAHWSFQPLRETTPPEAGGSSSSHPIDLFVRARQERAGVKPVEPADRRALIRRASFDLTGLPPEPAQVQAFLEDERPLAFEEMIDQLLASPRYGERWGRHWLDLARYADTAGENSDYPIPQARLYRDYVIDSFNADKPYDQFLHEQIAGDILGREGEPEDYAERLIATGFLAQAKRFGTGDLEDMHLIIEDTLDTIGKVTMGLGMRCARCHDHKYDPTSMRDYYALYGFFQSTGYPFPGGESVRVQKYFAPTIHPDVLAARDQEYFARHQGSIEQLKSEIQTARTKSQEATRVAALARELESLKAQLDACSPEDKTAEKLKEDIALRTEEHKKAKATLDKAIAEIQSKLTAIEKASPSATAPLAYAVHEGKSSDAHVQKLGNPRSKGDLVKRGVPSFLDSNAHLQIPEGSSGRLQFARWLTSPENPLTARVMVNRIWQHHFGRPIVGTPSDFGMQGERPTHPELLDWLAVRFIQSGWSIKAMHRLIMSSETWRLASAHDGGNEATDPGNKLYWRHDRRRLDAESIRDSLLMLGESLDLARPGPHPFPPANKWRFSAHHQFKAVYPSNHRSVYLMVQRLHPHPFLAVFNGPDTSATTARRDRAMVPQQALFMSNSELVENQSWGFAESLVAAEADERQRINLAYRRAFSRPPTLEESKRARAFLSAYAELAASEGALKAEQEFEAWTAFARTLLTSNEFVFVD